MILCLILHVNTLFCLLFSYFHSFSDPGPSLGGLFLCTGFFSSLKIAALIPLIVNPQAVTAKQLGPLESVNACD